jgi:hypothetical protein
MKLKNTIPPTTKGKVILWLIYPFYLFLYCGEWIILALWDGERKLSWTIRCRIKYWLSVRKLRKMGWGGSI